MSEIPKKFRLLPGRTSADREDAVGNLNLMVHWIKRLIKDHIRVMPPLTIRRGGNGIVIGAEPQVQGGPTLAILDEELLPYPQNDGAKSRFASSDKEIDGGVFDIMGFYGDPIPEGSYIWIQRAKATPNGESRWYVVNAPGVPGCDGCGCDEDEDG